jgi:hypothetical protein
VLQRGVGAPRIAQRTLAIPSANSSSMLSKLPCPFIGAQSPLSTHQPRLHRRQLALQRHRAEALADLALDVLVAAG